MTDLTPITFAETDIDRIAGHSGRIAVFLEPEGRLDAGARRVNRLTKGALQRLVESERFAKLKPGDVLSMGYPAGMAAEAVDVIHLPRRAEVMTARKAGAALATRRVADVAFGLAMRDYGFEDHKSSPKPRKGSVEVMCSTSEDAREAAAPLMAVAEGAFMTRDLTNAPANILTTTNFAERLTEMESLGLKVEVLDEEDLATLGMRTLLSVGQGSDSPSKVVVMRWEGGAEGTAPLALVGKGVVFDTGGISLKPGAGM